MTWSLRSLRNWGRERKKVTKNSEKLKGGREKCRQRIKKRESNREPELDWGWEGEEKKKKVVITSDADGCLCKMGSLEAGDGGDVYVSLWSEAVGVGSQHFTLQDVG